MRREYGCGHPLNVFGEDSIVDPYKRLSDSGIELPPAAAPLSTFVMAAQTGNLVFVSGHIARKDGKPWVGQLGVNMTTDVGKLAARSVGIDLLATLHSSLGDLKRVERILKLLCLVNSGPTFTEQHLVANGCSELLISVLGDAARHARSAFGVAQLPLGACVEIELIAQVAS
jgi:enamine deaminase RidA (YjgF/YER057c/UK114 family)